MAQPSSSRLPEFREVTSLLIACSGESFRREAVEEHTDKPSSIAPSAKEAWITLRAVLRVFRPTSRSTRVRVSECDRDSFTIYERLVGVRRRKQTASRSAPTEGRQVRARAVHELN